MARPNLIRLARTSISDLWEVTSSVGHGNPMTRGHAHLASTGESHLPVGARWVPRCAGWGCSRVRLRVIKVIVAQVRWASECWGRRS